MLVYNLSEPRQLTDLPIPELQEACSKKSHAIIDHRSNTYLPYPNSYLTEPIHAIGIHQSYLGPITLISLSLCTVPRLADDAYLLSCLTPRDTGGLIGRRSRQISLANANREQRDAIYLLAIGACPSLPHQQAALSWPGAPLEQEKWKSNSALRWVAYQFILGGRACSTCRQTEQGPRGRS